MKTIRVLPGENEDKFIKLYAKFKFRDAVSCRLGSIFGWPYNEYDVKDYDYVAFKEELDEINYVTTMLLLKNKIALLL